MYLGVARWSHEDKTIKYKWNADSQGDISDSSWLRWKLNLDEATPEFPDDAPNDERKYIKINGQVHTGCLKKLSLLRKSVIIPRT